MSERQRFNLHLPGLLKVLAEHLYSSKKVGVRELIQNAHDSCVRRKIEAVEPRYRPRIDVDLDPKRVSIGEGRLPVYFGLGLRVLAGGHAQAGIRLPLGLSYLADRAPVEVFAELVPVLKFAPDTGGDVEGGVGVRYYFKTGR